MPDILTSLHGRRVGLDKDDNLILTGNRIFGNNGGTPVALAGVGTVAAGSALTLTKETHSGKTILLDTLTGSVVTLPAANGSGARFAFFVSVLATSNSHIVKVANASDIMAGIIATLDSDLATVNMFGFRTGATSDTITLDRTNTGSVTVGEWLELEDIAANLWAVRGQLSGAAPATPFSATV